MVEAAAPAACMTALRRRQQQLSQVASRVRQLLQRRCHHRLCRRHQPRRHAAVPRTWSAPPPTAPRSSFGRRRRSPRLLRTDVARGSGIRQVGTLTLPQATVRTMAWMTKMTRRTMKMTNCLKHCYYHLCVDFFACYYYYSCCSVSPSKNCNRAWPIATPPARPAATRRGTGSAGGAERQRGAIPTVSGVSNTVLLLLSALVLLLL